MRPCRVCARPLLWGGDKLRGVHPACELRAPQASPVEGPAGDPQVPPEQGDPRAPTVPAPPPTEPEALPYVITDEDDGGRVVSLVELVGLAPPPDPPTEPQGEP